MAVGPDNWCRYQFTPNELYQRGAFNESHCGQETYQGTEDYDEPVKASDGTVSVVTRTRFKEQFDPYCPEHGGTSAPQDSKVSSEVSSSGAD